MEEIHNKTPRHIAIIMDGNGRWAQQRGLERVYGHQAGTEAVRRAVEACAQANVQYLTLYAFSTENWNRPKAEVDALMHLLVKALHDEVPKLMKNKVRLNAIGAMEDLPQACQDEFRAAIAETSQNTGLTLTIALSYSGRNEWVRVAKKVFDDVECHKIAKDDICETYLNSKMDTAQMPDPDILIRTGGECRISNFLLWQLAYTELFFLPVMWPDFNGDHLREVISQFQLRERRFGKTSAQVTTR